MPLARTVLALALLVLTVGGCAVRVPASPQRLSGPVPETDELWPARAKEPVVLRIGNARHPHRLRRVAHTASGTLLRIDEIDAFTGTRPRVTDIVDSEGKLITRATGEVPPLPAGLAVYVFASSPLVPVRVELSDETHFTIDARASRPMISFLAVEEPPAPPRGIAVMLNSISGSTWGEKELREELSARGWLVIQVGPSLNSLERLLLVADDPSQLGTVAGHVARRIDDCLAERAYATETMLSYVLERHPALAPLPVVLVGCSAGAVNLPTVAARLPGTFDAAVLVAGGSNLAQIVTQSDLMRTRIQVRVGERRASRREREALLEAALARSSLDPQHTAVHLRGIPVLMLHAKFDRIVPAASGDALYEQLGRPERWSYALGHLGLFAWLTLEADEVADWIDRALLPGPYTEPGAAPATAPGGTP